MANLNPYISFGGNAREALEFYQSVLGGELTVSTFGEFQMPGVGEDEQDCVMHGNLHTPADFTLMAADHPSSMGPLPEGSNITISLSGGESDHLREYWEGLSAGGQVEMPLEQAPWGDSFGQFTDRYGVRWMVNIAGAGQAGSDS